MTKKIHIIFIAAMLMGPVLLAHGKTDATVTPPIITLYNKNVSNNEIFYVGGAAIVPGAAVLIYIQKENGGVITEEVSADETGQWFYSHPEFLSKGKYTLWTQLKVDDLISPPSFKIGFEVIASALQIGNLRISQEMLYASLAVLFLTVALFLLIFILYHAKHHRNKSKMLAKEIADAERFVLHGFMDLRKDIKTELEKSGDKNYERKSRLLADLELIERHLGEDLQKMDKMGF